MNELVKFILVLLTVIILLAVAVFWDEIRKLFSRKCRVCGGVGYHKLSCPNNNNKQKKMYLNLES